MKIIDCTSFYNEHMMYEVRLNVLKDKVDKFIVTESTYSHSGKKKKLNFDINNYPKFKDKIKYIVIDKEPDGIVEENNNPTLQRANSLKRIELSYDEHFNAIRDANDDDFIMLSDNDEIPNLDSKDFKKNKIISSVILPYPVIIDDKNFSYLRNDRAILTPKSKLKRFIPAKVINFISFLFYILHIPYLSGRYPNHEFYKEHFFDKKMAYLKNVILKNQLNTKNLLLNEDFYLNDLIFKLKNRTK